MVVTYIALDRNFKITSKEYFKDEHENYDDMTNKKYELHAFLQGWFRLSSTNNELKLTWRQFMNLKDCLFSSQKSSLHFICFLRPNSLALYSPNRSQKEALVFTE